MLNVTVVGTVRDDSGHLQSGSYTVEYKDRGVTSPTMMTDNSQINFNIGDHTHLGCGGTMRAGEVLYVNFTNDAGTKSARRIHTYNGENVILLDVVSKEDWGLSSLLTVDEISDGVYRLSSVCTGGTNVFRVYICGKSVFEDNPINCDWKLVRTIETNEHYVDVVFAKSIKAKIEVESVLAGHTGNLDDTVVDVTVGYDIVDPAAQQYFLEWE